MKTIVRNIVLALLAVVALVGLSGSPANALVAGPILPQYPCAPTVSVTTVVQDHSFRVVSCNPGPNFYPTTKYEYQFTIGGIAQPVQSALVSTGPRCPLSGCISATAFSVNGPLLAVDQGAGSTVVSFKARTTNKAGTGAWSAPISVLEYYYPIP